MVYDDEFLDKIIGMGTLQYPIEKIVNVLDITHPAFEAEFRKDFVDPGSQIYKAYQKGVDKGDYEIDKKLFQLTQEGDIKSYRLLEERKQQRKDETSNTNNNWIPE